MTVQMPEATDDFCVGPGGTLLALRLARVGKLAIVDASMRKIVGYVTLEEPDDLFAAGAEKLVVVARKSRVARRYSLLGLKQEAEALLPGESPIVVAGTGASLRGPLFMICGNGPSVRGFAVEPATLQLLEGRMDFQGGLISANNAYARMSYQTTH